MKKRFLKIYTTAGLRSSIANVRREIEILRKHRKGLRPAGKLFSQQHLRLHVGCGFKRKNGYINIDLSSHAEITLDMREPILFRENSCSIVYSEHFLEHLDYPEPTNSFLKECFRILESGGLFSVGVPDTISKTLFANTYLSSIELWCIRTAGILQQVKSWGVPL